MAEQGQRFYQKLLDGKIHECEYVEQYLTYSGQPHSSLWVAKVIDNHGGYRTGQTFLCDSGY